MQKYIYYSKEYQSFYMKIKCDLLNFRGVQTGYHQDFEIWNRSKMLCQINPEILKALKNSYNSCKAPCTLMCLQFAKGGAGGRAGGGWAFYKLFYLQFCLSGDQWENTM